MPLRRGSAESYTYAVPSQAYPDGEIVLNFNRLAGPNAAVSEVSIFEANPTTSATGTTLESAESSDETIGQAIRMSEEVVIDGTLDEWPPPLPNASAKLRQPRRFSCSALYAQWNGDNFYIAGVINRDAEPPPTPRKAGGDEALHLFIDTMRTRSPGMYTPSEHHFVFTIHNPHRSPASGTPIADTPSP